MVSLSLKLYHDNIRRGSRTDRVLTSMDQGVRVKKIVVAVEESEESMYALSWCITNLVPVNADSSLVLLYVKPLPPLYSPLHAAAYMFVDDVVAELGRYGSELASSVMSRAEAVCRKFGTNMDVEKRVGAGDAKDVICRAVQKMQADILVIGCHGYSFLKRALLGSVSDYCTKNVKCPVVVVKGPEN